MKFKRKLLTSILTLAMVLSITTPVLAATQTNQTFEVSSVSEFETKAYAEVNGNVPYFSEKMISDAKTKAYESYSKLDKLGRCGVCVASIDQSLMPTEKRGEIGQVKPTGWKTVKYNDIIEGNYLYNRCHLIGYQLTGENANTKNLITGTRYLNVDGMLPFENKVANYIKKSKSNKVLYRVTPIYEGNNLVASGVLMEAMSLNDGGKAVKFNVYCYNVQPGIIIDYSNGNSSVDPNGIGKAVGESVKSANNVKNSSNKAVKNEDRANTPIKETTPSNEPKTTVTEQTPLPVTEAAPVDGVAWLSATGSKYHSINNCGRMNPDKATQTTISAAKAAGYDACSKCW